MANNLMYIRMAAFEFLSHYSKVSNTKNGRVFILAK